MRVTIGVQQAGFGSEDAAAAVAVDRAAFEDDAGDEAAAALQLGDAARDLVIEIERRILAAPGVVVPVDEGGGERLRIADCGLQIGGEECWSVIAAPGVVSGDVVEGDVFQVADE